MSLRNNLKVELEKIIRDFEKSVNTVDISIQINHLFLDDNRFTEIEDFIPQTIGAKGVLDILNWLKENGKSGNNINFQNVKYYQLSKDVVHTNAVQNLNFDNNPSKSRVTFIFINKNEKWGLIHAHYSSMPKKED